MNPLNELTSALSRGSAHSIGRVVRVRGGAVEIAASEGLIVHPISTGQTYRPGDDIVLLSGTPVARYSTRRELSVFWL